MHVSAQVVDKDVGPLRGEIPSVSPTKAPARSRHNSHASLEGAAHWPCIPGVPAASTTGHRGMGAAPILSPAKKIALPAPAEPDHAWSWLARGKHEWLTPAEIGPANTQAAWGEALEIHEGWLRLTNSKK